MINPYQNNIFSIIIPIYGNKPNIKNNFKKIFKELKGRKSFYLRNWEVIAVIDGKDNETYKVLKSFKESNFSIYQYNENMGKGYALLYGFKKSKGNYITFLDADGDIPFKQIFNFFPYLATGDVVIGSKRHPFSQLDYPLFRKILSKGFQILSFIILGSRIKDTQSGLKIIKREVLDVLSPLIKINRFTFDLELCFLAGKHGFRIVEVPIKIEYRGSSTVGYKTIFNMFFDLIKIRFWYSVKKVYQNKFYKNKF